MDQRDFHTLRLSENNLGAKGKRQLQTNIQNQDSRSPDPPSPHPILMSNRLSRELVLFTHSFKTYSESSPWFPPSLLPPGPSPHDLLSSLPPWHLWGPSALMSQIKAFRSRPFSAQKPSPAPHFLLNPSDQSLFQHHQPHRPRPNALFLMALTDFNTLQCPPLLRLFLVSFAKCAFWKGSLAGRLTCKKTTTVQRVKPWQRREGRVWGAQRSGEALVWSVGCAAVHRANLGVPTTL